MSTSFFRKQAIAFALTLSLILSTLLGPLTMHAEENVLVKTSFKVNLTNSTSFVRPDWNSDVCGREGIVCHVDDIEAGYDLYNYSVTKITPQVTGNYTIEGLSSALSDGEEETNDIVLLLYGEPFDPEAPLKNIIALNDDAQSSEDNTNHLLGIIKDEPLTAEVNYYLIMTTYDPGTTGKVEFQISGPGEVTVPDEETPEPDTTAPTGSLTINNGSSFTSTTNVTLSITSSDNSGSEGIKMQFANAGEPFSEWETATGTKAWTLSSGDGPKEVQMKLKDAAGNITATNIVDTITLDTTAPTGSLTIHNGSSFTNTTSVTLSITSSDNSGLEGIKMQFANAGEPFSEWETATGTKAWTLSSGDGPKEVQMKLKDAAGNITATNIVDTITLDTTAATGSLTIHNGSSFTNTTSVTLTITSSDNSGSEGIKMQFANAGEPFSEWETAAGTKAWTLSSGDGPKEVQMRLKDAAGNITATNIVDTITLDTTAPTGTLVINEGDSTTYSQHVRLAITSNDDSGSGNIQMRFSNDAVTWSEWETAAASKEWTLSNKRDDKTVYMELKDDVGNKTVTAITDSIRWIPQPSQTETIVVNVENGVKSSGEVVSTAIINRTTDANGRKLDAIIFTSEQTQKSIEQLQAASSDVAKLVVPDPKDDVSEILVTLPLVSTSALANAKINLEINTVNGSIIVPSSSLQGLTDDVYFRVVPIKSESGRSEAEQRAKTNEIVLKVTGGTDVQVIGRPMTIETNLQSKAVTLVLPLGTEKLSEEQLKHIGVFIEHSDGQKEWVTGKIVPYGSNGALGIQFTVDKFSTFTIVSFDRDDEHTAYITGYPDGTFKPEKAITRAEMATILIRLYKKDGLQTSTSYSDVTPSFWAKEAIDKVTALGLMKGYPDGSFQPSKTITRAEMAVIADRLLASQVGVGAGFPDTSGHWAKSSIVKVQAAKLIKGYEDGTFRPENALTRAEAVTIMNKLIGRGPLTGASQQWKDVSDKHWAYTSIQEASINHSFEALPGNGEQWIVTP